MSEKDAEKSEALDFTSATSRDDKVAPSLSDQDLSSSLPSLPSQEIPPAVSAAEDVAEENCREDQPEIVANLSAEILSEIVDQFGISDTEKRCDSLPNICDLPAQSASVNAIPDAFLANSEEVLGGSGQKAQSSDLSLNLNINNGGRFYIGEDLNSASPKSPRSTKLSGSFHSLPDKDRRRPSLMSSLIGKSKKKKKPQIFKSSKPDPVKEFVPPDGGYGWVIVVAACVVNMWIVGFIKSYSLIYVEVKNRFPDASAYHASWIPALLSTIGLLVAPIAGILCRKYTSRKVSFCGGLLVSAGMFFSAFTTSLTQLIFTIGVLTGLGAGFTQTPGILIVSLYFKDRRAIASAIVISGNSIGSFYMPPLIEYLLSEYRLQGTFLLLAALQLHISVASLLYRPVKEQAKIQARERARMAATQKNGDDSEKNLLSHGEGSANDFHPSNSKQSFRRSGSSSLFSRVRSSKLLSEMSNNEETQHVSFLRSTSMVGSVPDLCEYARSVNVSMERNINIVPTSEMRPVVKRSHTVSESEAPDNIIFKSNSGFGLNDRSKPASIRKVHSSLGRMVLTKQAASRLPPGTNLTSLGAKELGSSICSIPNEPAIPETDEDENETNEDAPTEDLKETPVISAPASEEFKESAKLSEEPTEKQEETSNGCHCPPIFKVFGACFDKEVLKTRRMIIFTTSVMMVAVGAPHALFYLHAYSKSVGVDPSRVTTMLSVSSVVDLVGRLGIGFLADMKIIPTAYIYLVSCALGGSAVLAISFSDTFLAMSILLCAYGVGIGAYFVLIPTVLAQNHGIAKLNSSYSFIRFCMGFMNFISPQISGALVDYTGSFSAVYYFMGTSMVTAAAVVLLEQLFCRSEPYKDKDKIPV